MELLEHRAYLSSAPFDPEFGSSGVKYTGVPDGTANAMYADGRILILAHDTARWDSERIDFFRFTADGKRDESFGPDGRVVTTFADDANAFNHRPITVAVQLDGKIVVGGWIYVHSGSTSDQRLSLARYNADGTIDSTFGVGGYVVDQTEKDSS